MADMLRKSMNDAFSPRVMGGGEFNILNRFAEENKKKQEEEQEKARKEQEAIENARNAAYDAAMEEAKSGYVSSLKKLDMQTSIRDVCNMLKENPVYSIFIEFTMNSDNLKVSTISTNTKENIVMSLQNDKNGTGKANQFTLTIAYAPQVDSEFDINAIDEAITKANDPEQKAQLRYCTLQYGYANKSGATYRSPLYRGMVLNYNCEIQDGILIYTITGYSGMSTLKESKEALAIHTGVKTDDGKIRATQAARQLVEMYLQAGRTDKVLVADTSAVENEEGEEEQKAETTMELDRTPLDPSISYELTWGDKDVLDSDVEVEIPAQLDKNPASALTDILNKARAQKDQDTLDESQSVSPTEKTTYGWYISDVSSDPETYPSGSICIYRRDPVDIEKQKEVSSELVFNWMSPGTDDQSNHFVISFKPEYEGSVLMAIASGKAINSKSFYQNNDGVVISTENSIAPPVGGSDDAVILTAEQEKASWADKVQYPYNATLITMGVPAEIPILAKIKIRPLIYGKEHHSGGIYMVRKITDILDASGFRTTWELTKVWTPVKIGSVSFKTETEDGGDTTTLPPELQGASTEEWAGKDAGSHTTENVVYYNPTTRNVGYGLVTIKDGKWYNNLNQQVYSYNYVIYESNWDDLTIEDIETRMDNLAASTGAKKYIS